MIEFSSDKVAPILMLDEPARWVLHAIGATGNVPSALNKEEIQAVIVKLKAALHELKKQEAIDLRMLVDEIENLTEDELEEANKSGAVLLSHRIFVFLEFLEKVESKQGYLMWKHA